jgi:hypothetical protein
MVRESRDVIHDSASCGWAKGGGGRNGSTINNNSARFRGFNQGMKPLILFPLILLSATGIGSSSQSIRSVSWKKGRPVGSVRACRPARELGTPPSWMHTSDTIR